MNATLVASPPLSIPKLVAECSPLLRLRHQLTTEARLLCLPFLLWIAILILRTVDKTCFDLGPLSRHLDLATLMAACWLIFVSIRADAPADTNTASRTRPIGSGVLWLSKILSLFTLIAIPWLISDLITASGFAYTLREWLTLTASSLLLSTLFITASAATLSLATSPRQTSILLLVGTLATAAWIIIGQGWLSAFDTSLLFAQNSPPPLPQSVDTLQACGAIISALIAILIGALSWHFSAMRHRRALASLTLLIAIIQQPITQALWPIDWLAQSPLVYPQSLTLAVTKENIPTWHPSADFQPLTLHSSIQGLGKDEVASIIALAPTSDEAAAPWPPPLFYSDFEPGVVGGRSNETWNSTIWCRLDHLRTVSQQYSASDLWTGGISDREPPEIAKHLARKSMLNEASLNRPWLMRTAIHGMRKVVDIPLQQLLAGNHQVTIRPGIRLELDPVARPFFMAELKGRIHFRHPSPFRAQPHAPLQINGHRIPDNLLLTIHDPATNENTANSADYITPSLTPHRTIAWINEGTDDFTFTLPEPRARYFLTHLTFETWAARCTIQIWLPEYRGTIDLKITPEQIRQLTAP